MNDNVQSFTILSPKQEQEQSLTKSKPEAVAKRGRSLCVNLIIGVLGNMALYKLHTAVKNGDLSRVNELLQHLQDTADVNQPDSKGWTPLMWAASNPTADIDVLRALLRHGATIDQTSVSFALSDLQKLKLLIEAGADLLYEKEAGYDALINAAYGRNARHNSELLDILRLLIAKGVRLRGMTTHGESALRVLSKIGRFDAVHLLLDAGANPDDVKLTPLLKAVAFGSLDEVQSLVKDGANLEERDHWSRTAWLIAIQTGDIARAKFLLDHGADRNARGHCGKPPLFYAIENGQIPMLNWLLEIGEDVEQTDEFGDAALRQAVDCLSEECVEILLSAGANVNRSSKTGTALENATTRNIALRLIDAGADPQHLTTESKRAILGLPPEPNEDLLEASEGDFARHQTRRPADRNPEVMNNPFWEGMIRSGINAYRAGQIFGAADLDEPANGKYRAIWCAQRFGQSLTFLADGRIVQIGGEHEDFYDMDFCIYNDVFVHTPDGSISIYGYPESVFPPTDFHTATLIDNSIYLIGSLGFPPGRRYGETPVHRLDTTTFEIEPVQTTGEAPGWIYQHRATFASGEIRVTGGKIASFEDGRETHSDNTKIFLFDIERKVWRIEQPLRDIVSTDASSV